jgi:hypothetical protein
VFAIAYSFALQRSPISRPPGIWLVRPNDRIDTKDGHEHPKRLVATGLRALSWELYFSVLSAFHFGWRDLNIGNWIGRASPDEYVLRPIGWTKVASGIQALLSVYLLAIWALAYFGGPFG